NRHLALGGLGGLLQLWDVVGGRQVHTLVGHDFTIQALAFSPDGSRLASTSSDATLRTWRVATGQSEPSYRGHHGQVYSVAFHPNGDRLVSSGIDGTIKIWDALSEPTALHIEGRGNITITDLAFTPDGKRLVTMGLDRAVEVRDADSGELLRTLWSME